MDKPTVGRHVFEKDILYVKVPEADVRPLLNNFADKLSSGELDTLREYVEVMKKKSPFFGF